MPFLLRQNILLSVNMMLRKSVLLAIWWWAKSSLAALCFSVSGNTCFGLPCFIPALFKCLHMVWLLISLPNSESDWAAISFEEEHVARSVSFWSWLSRMAFGLPDLGQSSTDFPACFLSDTPLTTDGEHLACFAIDDMDAPGCWWSRCHTCPLRRSLLVTLGPYKTQFIEHSGLKQSDWPVQRNSSWLELYGGHMQTSWQFWQAKAWLLHCKCICKSPQQPEASVWQVTRRLLHLAFDHGAAIMLSTVRSESFERLFAPKSCKLNCVHSSSAFGPKVLW